jgi:FlaA1/EpsC-like NDP-sugar epimerase
VSYTSRTQDGVADGDRGHRAPLRSLAHVAREAARLRGDLPFIAVDAVLVASVYLGLVVLRFNGSVPNIWWSHFRPFLVAAICIHLVANRVAGLYGPLWRHAGIREAQRLFSAGILTVIAVPLVAMLPPLRLPLSVTLVGPAVATGLIGLSRFQTRLFSLRRRRISNEALTTGLRVVILGAGNAGASLAREMLANPKSGLVPVAFLDDDQRTHGRSLLGVRVLGSIESLPAVVAPWRLNYALLAVRGAQPELVQRAMVAAEEGGIPLQTIPTVDQLVTGKVGLRDVRDLQIDDLLGRHQVETDSRAIHKVIAGCCVMVTGGGGSIGSEIARQVHAGGASRVVLVDHDETHLHDAALDIPGAVQVLADVRDADQMRRVFAIYRPEMVFHAAAHKHVPILEVYPEEALRTNVIGTANVLAAADACGTKRLIVISTDKAVRAVSSMGASKRMAERLLVAHATPGRQWCAVRFGNVLASRGSVVPTFERQIRQGGPVTVTDADMTRYFMSIAEAVELVLQSAVLAEGGEVFMLDMGEPVRILDLAKRMIHLSGRQEGRDIEIQIVGRRPGEKLQEELHHPEEGLGDTDHPSIRRVVPAPERLDALLEEVGELEAAARLGDAADLRAALIAAANEGLASTAPGDPFEADRRELVLDLSMSDSSAAPNRPADAIELRRGSDDGRSIAGGSNAPTTSSEVNAGGR